MTLDAEDTKQEAFLLDEKPKIFDDDSKKCWNPLRRNSQGEGGIDYLALIGAFFVQFFILGIMNNTGSLKGYWVNEFEISPTYASLAGSLNYGFMFSTGIFATALEKRIGFANMHCLGCLICAFSLLCASFAPSFTYVLVAYGGFFGIGASLTFFSSIYVQLYYFKSKLSLTSGIVSSGSGLGTMTLAATLDKLCVRFGWRGTLYVFAATLIASTLFSLFYRTADFRNNRSGIFGRLFAATSSQIKIKSDRNKCASCLLSIVDFSPLKNPGYVIFVIGCFLFMLGYLIPFLYVKDLAVTVGVNPLHASKLVGYMSIASIVGRLAIGNLTLIPRVKAIYLFQMCLLLIGFIHISSRFCLTLFQFVAYAIAFGFFEGGYVSLTNVVVVDILGQQKGPSGLGLLYALKAIPIIAASPLSTLLYGKFNSFSIMIMAAGGSAALGASVLSFIYCIPSNEIKIEIREDSNSFTEKRNIFVDEELFEETFNQSRQDI